MQQFALVLFWRMSPTTRPRASLTLSQARSPKTRERPTRSTIFRMLKCRALQAIRGT